jgi:hypothetical protein
MIFNIYEYKNGGISLVKPSSVDDKGLLGYESCTLLGTIDPPIQPVKKEVEKVEQTIGVERLYDGRLPNYLIGNQVVVPRYSIPSDAYDIEVHYKIKE